MVLAYIFGSVVFAVMMGSFILSVIEEKNLIERERNSKDW
jgi:hypothetical protein